MSTKWDWPRMERALPGAQGKARGGLLVIDPSLQ